MREDIKAQMDIAWQHFENAYKTSSLPIGSSFIAGCYKCFYVLIEQLDRIATAQEEIATNVKAYTETHASPSVDYSNFPPTDIPDQIKAYVEKNAFIITSDS